MITDYAFYMFFLIGLPMLPSLIGFIKPDLSLLDNEKVSDSIIVLLRIVSSFVAVIGAVFIYAAFVPEVRTMVAVMGAAEKFLAVGAFLMHYSSLKKRLKVALVIDFVSGLLFLGYLIVTLI